MPENIIGIIGGSGLYEIEGLKKIKKHNVKTPFGNPSDTIIQGTLNNVTLLFLPRHGKGHRLNPSEVNYRANIYALKKLGATRVISVSAVGSLRENIAPGTLVFVDQYIDRTLGSRKRTFFEEGLVAHVGFGDPSCQNLREILEGAAKKAGASYLSGGTYICIEGPQFSTRVESFLYRSWNADVIGMTNLPEAKLAREAELCYCTMALVTDYDCWHEEEEDVQADAVLEVIAKNVGLAKKIIANATEGLTQKSNCKCGESLKHALVRDPKTSPPKTYRKLELLVKKYLRGKTK
ncbi:MAG TPA: S-methyl-5'-thioadenosine phosphorylase [Bdellovibrionota bacterium]|nr:S-methyl-5'-thioadenosine phosphorylase [Bdellovibrionota bacterium]